MKSILSLCALLFLCNLVSAQIPAYIPTSGLQGWFPFNGNANNGGPGSSSRNGIVLGPTLTADRFGNTNSAYHFNGDADHILIDTAFFDVGWSNYTVSLWLNADDTDNSFNGNNNMSMFNTIPHHGLCLVSGWQYDYKYKLWVNETPGVPTWNILFGVESNQRIKAHVWRHYLVVKKNDTSYSFYLNGVLDSSYSNMLFPTTHLCRIVLGNTDSTVTNFGFMGSLDDYAIWNRALAGCEVRRLYNASPYSYITAQSVNTSVGVGATARFTIADTGTGTTFQWQVSSGTAYTNLANTSPYSGVTTPTLTITGVTNTLNAKKYRCVVSSPQPCVDTSAYAVLTVHPAGVANVAAPEFSIVPNPTDGNITIIGAGEVNIKVYNSIGQLVAEKKLAKTISLETLPAGIYLVKLFDEHGQPVYSSKVMRK